jgi:phosphoglycerate kinase
MKIGDSLFDTEGAKLIPKIMEEAKKYNVEIILPDDFINAKEFKQDSE